MEEKNSIIVSGLMKFFKVLNEFYEYSITYKALNKIGSVALKSFIIGNSYKGITMETHNNYAEGSLLIRFIFNTFTWFFGIFKRLYLFFARLNLKSKNKMFFDKFISPLATLEKGAIAVFSVLFGLFSVKTILAVTEGISYTLIGINLFLSITFLILILIDFKALARIVNGSIAKKFLMWLFN